MKFWWAILMSSALAKSALASYGSACSNDAQCGDDARFCLLYFVDGSFQRNKIYGDIKPRYYGLCVECLVDCDCGVNQYCGTDPSRPIAVPQLVSENNETGPYTFTGQMLNLLSASFSGMALRSKCMSYDDSKSCLPTPSGFLGSYSKVVEQYTFSAGDPSPAARPVLRTPSGWPRDLQSRYCGKIRSFAPSHYTVQVLGNQMSSLTESRKEYQRSQNTATGSFFDSPAVCPSWAISKDDRLSCKPCIHGSFCEHTDFDQSYCCTQSTRFRSTDATCMYGSYRSCQQSCLGSNLDFPGDFYLSCTPEPRNLLDLSEADFSSYCACLSSCNNCVSAAGGCSGTCTGPCASPGATPPPTQSSDAICPVQSTGTALAAEPASCQPSCIECLAVAAACGACANKVPTLRLTPSCRVDGQFDVTSGDLRVMVNSPAIEWSGTCAAGTCRVCDEQSTRCKKYYSSNRAGIPQKCMSGRWVEDSEWVQGLISRGEGLAMAAAGGLVAVAVGVLLLVLVGCWAQGSRTWERLKVNTSPAAAVAGQGGVPREEL